AGAPQGRRRSTDGRTDRRSAAMTRRSPAWPVLAFALLIVASLFSSAGRANTAAAAPPEREILVMLRQGADHYRPTGDYGGAYGDQFGQSARKRLAKRIARQYGLTLTDNWPMPMIGVDCFVMIVPDGQPTSAAAERVSHDADV